MTANELGQIVGLERNLVNNTCELADAFIV